MHIFRVETVTTDLLEMCARLMPQLTRRPAPTPQELQSLIESSSVLLAARYPDADSPLVGMGTLAVFRSPTGLHAHVEDVVVDETLRGRGIGEAIVHALLDVARDMGLDGVSLTCNPRRESANRLYQRMGFEKWETNVYWFAVKEK